jgi:UDP-MurNAc hydroxylase
MRADGIEHCALERLELGRTILAVVPNATSSYDIDSALVVRRDDHSVVNMNDNLLHRGQIARILELTGGPPQIALLGYTGAGAYPQTYYEDSERLHDRAEAKKRMFFGRYLQMRDALNPLVSVPFAGKYLLGGKLHQLNGFRGVADACEVLSFDERAIVLADGGRGAIDTLSLAPSAVRTEPYDLDAMIRYAATLAHRPMTYERFFSSASIAALPLKRLLPKAFANARQRSLVSHDYYFCIKLGREWFTGNAHRERGDCSFVPEVGALRPRSELDVDPRYLFGLLTGVFHWNNAEIGSQYRTTRVPDLYDRDTQAFLSFFHV